MKFLKNYVILSVILYAFTKLSKIDCMHKSKNLDNDLVLNDFKKSSNSLIKNKNNGTYIDSWSKKEKNIMKTNLNKDKNFSVFLIDIDAKISNETNKIKNQRLDALNVFADSIRNSDFSNSFKGFLSRTSYYRNMQADSQNVNNSDTNNQNLFEDEENFFTVDFNAQKEIRGNCFAFNNGYFYDLSNIKWSGGSSSVYTIKTHKNSAIKFDICNDIPDANCTDFSSNVYDAKNCIHYSSTSKSDKYWKFVNEEKKFNENDPSGMTKVNKIILTTKSGEECAFGIFYKVNFEIECDMNQKDPVLLNYVFDMDKSKCDLNLKIKSRYACPIRQFKTWISKLGLFRIGIGYVLIISGVILSFKGLFYSIMLDKKNHLVKTQNEIIFLGKNIRNDLYRGKVLFSLINGFSISLISYSFVAVYFELNILYPFIFGLILSFVAYIRFYSNISFQVFIFSCLVTSILYNSFFGIFMKISPIAAYYIFFYSVTILAFSIRFYYFKEILNPILPHTVSLLSSYIIVRGISFIIGEYPDEILLYELLIHHEYKQVKRYFHKQGYLYLFSIIMLYLILLIVNKLIIKETKEELEKENIEKIYGVTEEEYNTNFGSNDFNKQNFKKYDIE